MVNNLLSVYLEASLRFPETDQMPLKTCGYCDKTLSIVVSSFNKPNQYINLELIIDVIQFQLCETQLVSCVQ